MEMGRQKQRRKQRKRKQRRRKQRALNAAAAGGVVGAIKDAVQSKSGEIWSSTFKSLLQWHQQQVQRICRVQEEEENEEEEEEEEDEVQETLQEQAENMEDEFEVDPDYLSFLEVTIKHQQELKQMRAAAATAEA